MDTDYKKALEGRTIKEVICSDAFALEIRLDNGIKIEIKAGCYGLFGAPRLEYSLIADCELIEREQ